MVLSAAFVGDSVATAAAEEAKAEAWKLSLSRRQLVGSQQVVMDSDGSWSADSIDIVAPQAMKQVIA